MARKLTESQLQTRGFALLMRELGYPDAVRFVLAASKTGRNYATDRDRMLKGVTLDQLMKESERIVAKERQRVRRKSA